MSPLRPRRQRGVTLVIAMIMLMALGLLAAFAVRVGNANLLIVNNSQMRHGAFATAQAAIERTLSTPAFMTQPAVVAATPVPIDLDGDGRTDMSATLNPAPTCYRWRALRLIELDAARPGDLACMGSGLAANAGIETSGNNAGGNSLCAENEWNLRAVVTDPSSGASVAVNQGVAVRGLITDVGTTCP